MIRRRHRADAQTESKKEKEFEEVWDIHQDEQPPGMWTNGVSDETQFFPIEDVADNPQ